MIDKEKVLKGLECCADRTGKLCKTCPYDFIHNENCMGDMARDALELIKEQEEKIKGLSTLLDFAHAAISHGKKEGLTNGARPGRNRENPASHV